MDIDGVTIPTASLSGKPVVVIVRDATGTPIPGVRVHLFSKDSPTPAVAGSTGANGAAVMSAPSAFQWLMFERYAILPGIGVPPVAELVGETWLWADSLDTETDASVTAHWCAKVYQLCGAGEYVKKTLETINDRIDTFEKDYKTADGDILKRVSDAEKKLDVLDKAVTALQATDTNFDGRVSPLEKADFGGQITKLTAELNRLPSRVPMGKLL